MPAFGPVTSEACGCAGLHVPNLSFGDPTLDEFFALEKPPGQIWVAWSMESACHYPALIRQDLHDRFDLVWSFRCPSDLWSTYAPDLEVIGEGVSPRQWNVAEIGRSVEIGVGDAD